MQTGAKRLVSSRYMIKTSSNTVMMQLQQQELIQEDNELDIQIPVCGGNLSTPVGDTAYYIDEISYQIGGIKYIENAD